MTEFLFEAGPLLVRVEGRAPFATAVQKLFRPALVDRERSSSRAADVFYRESEGRLFRHAATGPEALVGDLHEALPVRLEQDLLDQFPLKLADCVSLHAALVVVGTRPVVLIAPSGGGKSTITLALVRLGARFESDDALFLDDGKLIGLGRSIRFKPIPFDARVPDFAAGFDLDCIAFRDDDQDFRVPVWPGPYGARRAVDSKSEPVTVVRVVRGDAERLHPLSRLQRLKALYEASLTSHRCYAGELDEGETYELSWNEPAAAARLLMDALARR